MVNQIWLIFIVYYPSLGAYELPLDPPSHIDRK